MSTKLDATDVSEVFGGWHSGFAVEATYSNGEVKRVHLDRDRLVKGDGSYDMAYVSDEVEAQAPEEEKET